jgi:hypothetical protein
MSTKTIKINPDLFKVSTKKKSIKSTTALKSSLSPSQSNPSSSSSTPKLVKRIPKPKINTTKMKFQKSSFTKAEINVEQPLVEEKVDLREEVGTSPIIQTDLHLIADVPFGVLKGGNKPTYRQYYNKTLKKNSSLPLPSSSSSAFKKDKKEDKKRESFVSKKHKRHTLGKQRGIAKVGVLLKNKQTQKNVIDAQKKDKRTNLQEVKKYLYKHNLLKIGSSVPNNICRQIFENSKLTGEITNVNTETVLHNLEHKEENDHEKND